MSESRPPASDDIRPVVATGNPGRLGLFGFLILVLLGGAWIFSLMSQQRTALGDQSELAIIADGNGMITSPPPLAVPVGYAENSAVPRPRLLPRVVRAVPNDPLPASEYRSPPRSRNEPVAAATASPYVLPDTPPPAYRPTPYLEDARTAQPVSTQEAADDGRIMAGYFRNPSVTVPQGTVIPAVLETALDSTRPGGVRALVQSDVHSFDGTRVLIHRGSRLYGEYDGDLQRGQNRALIRWTRLIRPDGVTIALDSPASDPLGRAGVRGKVDGKFLQRFGGALLQSVLDIGVGVAASRASDGVIVALPGSTQNVSPRVSQSEVTPTLKIRHGTSVSVFVAHDLDFSAVET